jgi:glycosyltransferase involved in cell wall biosynthesis
LLARWLVPSQYGAYTIAFAIFLVVSSCHNSLLLEPMGVLGPSLHGKSLASYIGKLTQFHFLLSAVLAIAMVAGAIAVSHVPRFDGLPNALVGACLATPWVLFLWFARQAAYLELRPSIAVKGSIAYAVTILLMIFGLHANGKLTPFGAFIALAVSGAVGGSILLALLKPRFRHASGDASFRTIWKQHWHYGRWVLVTALVYWISGQTAYYFIAAALLKLDDVGTISALQNLVAPLSQFLTALSLLLLPWASTQLAGKGTAEFRKSIRHITLLFAAVGFAYFLFVVGFGRQLTGLLYHGKYSQSTGLLPMIALSQALMCFSQGPVIGLRAMQRPSRVFVGYSVSAVFSVVVGFWLTKHWGVFGNVVAMAASSFCFLATSAYCYLHERKDQVAQEHQTDAPTAANIRAVWLLPSMDRGSCWQPFFKEFTKRVPDTIVLTGVWNGYLKGYEDLFQLKTVPGYRFLTLKTKKKGYDQGIFLPPVAVIPQISKFRPSIIFTSAFSLWTLYALAFKLLNGTRVIILWEGNSPSADYRTSRFRLATRRLLGRFADGGVSNMHAGVDFLHSVIGMERSKLLRHPYEVPDSSVLHSGGGDEAVLQEVRRPIFLFVGSLIARKGWSSLLEAANLLVKRGIDSFSVVFVGTGGQAEEMSAQIRSYGLEQQVRQVGQVAYQDLGSYYRAADVFVFPTHEDTWGLVLLEAMAFGKPVLCSSNAGSAEMVSHGVNGFIFDSHDPTALADYMARFISDPNLIVQFGKSAAEAIAPFTPALAAETLSNFATHSLRPRHQPLPAPPASQAQGIPELSGKCKS